MVSISATKLSIGDAFAPSSAPCRTVTSPGAAATRGSEPAANTVPPSRTSLLGSATVTTRSLPAVRSPACTVPSAAIASGPLFAGPTPPTRRSPFSPWTRQPSLVARNPSPSIMRLPRRVRRSPRGPSTTRKPLPSSATSNGSPVGSIGPCEKSVSTTTRAIGVATAVASGAAPIAAARCATRSALNPGVLAFARLFVIASRRASARMPPETAEYAPAFMIRSPSRHVGSNAHATRARAHGRGRLAATATPARFAGSFLPRVALRAVSPPASAAATLRFSCVHRRRRRAAPRPAARAAPIVAQTDENPHLRRRHVHATCDLLDRHRRRGEGADTYDHVAVERSVVGGGGRCSVLLRARLVDERSPALLMRAERAVEPARGAFRLRDQQAQALEDRLQAALALLPSCVRIAAQTPQDRGEQRDHDRVDRRHDPRSVHYSTSSISRADRSARAGGRAAAATPARAAATRATR